MDRETDIKNPGYMVLITIGLSVVRNLCPGVWSEGCPLEVPVVWAVSWWPGPGPGRGPPRQLEGKVRTKGANSGRGGCQGPPGSVSFGLYCKSSGAPATSAALLFSSLPLTQSAPASLPFLKHAKHTPTSGPLHLLSRLP